MPIRVRPTCDPLSSAAIHGISEPILATSREGEILAKEMAAYANGTASGRSFLIAGHRGSGKSTLAAKAVLDLYRRSESSASLLRPLLVMLHGPSMLNQAGDDVIPGNAGACAADAGDDKRIQVALKEIILGLHRALARVTTDRFRAAAASSGGALRDGGQADEVAAQFELELWDGTSATRLWSLYRSIGVDRSGVFVPNPGARGLIRAIRGRRHDVEGAASYQGLAEIVALWSVIEAYRRISGRYRESDPGVLKQKIERQDEEIRKRSQSVRDIMAAFIPLLVGGTAGSASKALEAGTALSVVIGLAVTLISAGLFRLSTVRRRGRPSLEQFEYLPDLSPRTLQRFLPILLDRLRTAGIVPIFVVDELDKAEPALAGAEPGSLSRASPPADAERGGPSAHPSSQSLLSILRYLKQLTSDVAFFCFVLDRAQYIDLMSPAANRTYPLAYTYFTHRLLVAYSPRDWHGYLQARLEVVADDSVQQKEQEADLHVLPWIIRFRAQLHSVDVLRQLALISRQAGDPDRPEEIVSIPVKDVREVTRYRVDLTIQVYVEMILARPDVRERVSNVHDQLLVAYDALYYPTRTWLAGSMAVECDEARGRDSYVEYFLLQTGRRPDPSAVPPGSSPPSGEGTRGKAGAEAPDAGLVSDLGFGFRLVLQLMTELVTPDVDGTQTKKVRQFLKDQQHSEAEARTIVDSMLIQDQELVASVDPDRPNIFRWNYDTSGRHVRNETTRDEKARVERADGVIQHVLAAAERIRDAAAGDTQL